VGAAARAAAAVFTIMGWCCPAHLFRPVQRRGRRRRPDGAGGAHGDDPTLV